MLPSKFLVSICHLCYFALALVFSSPVDQESCSCWFTDTSITNGTKQLRCQRDNSINNDYPKLPCHRYNTLVRIGPVPSEIFSSTDASPTPSIGIENWGISELFADNRSSSLQLDLQLKNTELNALSLGGLDNVREFLGRNTIVRWDGCSFANMGKLEQVLLSCKSQFNGYLTFGSSIRLVRFVNCENSTLQFHCLSCQQNPAFNVIRISPGPPLGQYMVKFSQFTTSSAEEVTKNPNEGRRFSIGKCASRFCSDEMLCRDNLPLQMAIQNVGRTIQTTEFTRTPPPDLIFTDSPENDTSYAASSSLTDRFPYSAQNNETILSQHWIIQSYRKHIWITVAVVCLILVSTTALCVLIIVVRKGSQRQRRKRDTNSQRQLFPQSNGLPTSNVPHGMEQGTKLELQEALLVKPDEQVSISNTLESVAD